MKLTVGDYYKFSFDVGSQNITFTGELLDFDDDFITFKDKFGETLIYNKSRLVSVKEVSNA